MISDDVYSENESDCSMISRSATTSICLRDSCYNDTSLDEQKINDIKDYMDSNNDIVNLDSMIDGVETDDDLIKVCVKNELLSVIIYQYLSIKHIFVLFFITGFESIQKSKAVSRLSLFEIFRRILTMEANPSAYIHRFASRILKGCVHGIKHPFYFEQASLECVTIKSLFNKNISCEADIDNDSFLKRINYVTYFLFKLQSFQNWHLVFNNTPLCHHLKLFLSFAHNNISNEFIHETNIYKLDDYIKLRNTESKHLHKKFASLWVKYNVTTEDNHKQPYYQNECNFFDYFDAFYDVYIWIKSIDWRYFFIAGGSVASALLDLEPSVDSDVNIFCNGLTLSEFSNKITEIQANMRESGIGYQLYHLNKQNVLFILIISLPDGFKMVKLHFLWICEMLTIAQTLLSFDLGVVQVAFQPYPINKIYFTDSFLYFIKTSQCIVYNTIVERIKKYEDKGIINFLFKSEEDLPVHHNHIKKYNKINKRYHIKIQINDTEPFYLSRFAWYKDIICHSPFRCGNIDQKNLFKLFVLSIK